MPKPGKSTPDADDPASDSTLFREAVGGVRPVSSSEVEPRRRRTQPRPLQRLKDEADAVAELRRMQFDAGEMTLGEELSYLKTGVAPLTLRRLRRGDFSLRDELDLHQMTEAVARDAIARFLDHCRRNDKLCVKIVHGKGRRSKPEGPVLKPLTERLLRQRDDVLAYASARPAEGGTGAVVVLLKRLPAP